MTDEMTFHEQLTTALADADERALSAFLSGARAADIAESFQLLGDEERSRILFALDPHTAAEVVITLDEAVRGDVVEEMDTESLTEIVEVLPPDDAADVLGELTEEEAGEILEKMPEAKSDQIEELLEYEENTAGGIMTPDVVAVPATATVADAVQYVREASPTEDLHEIYIVDADRKLVGTVPLRRLVISAPVTKLADVCDRDTVVVSARADQETVVQEIRKYDAMAAAVVDDQGRLIGRITHDDLLDVAEEEAEEDLLRIAGTAPEELDTSSVLQAARIRLTWLLPCMAGMLLSASVLGLAKLQFDVVLFGALVLFVPMIGAIGGNSGIQTTTVIVRGFATGELGATQIMLVLLREGRIALTMAPVCGVAAWILASISLPLLSASGGNPSVYHPPRVAMAVGIAMGAAILVAASLGIALPFTFRRLGVDPAISSGPIVTTMNDVISVGIYMTVAMVIAR